MTKKNGENLSKWYITKVGKWLVCPPVGDDDPDWYMKGATFNTGAEALAAFAAGGVQ